MYDLASDTELNVLLNQFSVPMFAVDRKRSPGDFHLSCMNSALEVAGEKAAADVVGKSLYELLPWKEADTANARYAECAASRKDLRFKDRFTVAGRPVIWDTTLQHVPLSCGGDRVVGTAIRINPRDTGGPEMPVLDDIQYYSSMADLQLQNLISTFEIFRDRDLFSVKNEQHIDKLAGMCRTVQRAVEDIKRSVHATGHADLMAQAKRKMIQPMAGSDTIGALFADATQDMRRLD